MNLAVYGNGLGVIMTSRMMLTASLNVTFTRKMCIHVLKNLTGRLAQLVERRTCEHNVSGLYRCGFESPAGQLKLLIVFRMRR